MALIKWSELREEEFEDAVVFPAFEFGDVSGLVEWRGGVNIDPVLRLQLLKGSQGRFLRRLNERKNYNEEN